jgi:hypothetical protein
VPVNHSGGPLPEGCEPHRLISISNSFSIRLKQSFASELLLTRIYRARGDSSRRSNPHRLMRKIHDSRLLRMSSCSGVGLRCGQAVSARGDAHSSLIVIAVNVGDTNLLSVTPCG